MKISLLIVAMLFSAFLTAQHIKLDTLLTDNISIRAINIYDGKVWYAGSKSKFGYVNLSNPSDEKQIKVSDKELEFRTLARKKDTFYAINIGSPANFFEINSQTLGYNVVFQDQDSTAFYDALKFVDHFYAIAFSDPTASQRLNLSLTKNGGEQWINCSECKGFPNLEIGEAAFAASNSNIASLGQWIWIATGGKASKIYRSKNKNNSWEVFSTPFIQGASSQGIYSIDFANKKFGVAVGGDYTKQSNNINNIATTHDGGETWQIQASGHNAGYMTCVKIKPKSKGKEMIALGDQHISYSSDFGKTWTKISDEKGFYTAEWISDKALVLAGKNKIVKLTLDK